MSSATAWPDADLHAHLPLWLDQPNTSPTRAAPSPRVPSARQHSRDRYQSVLPTIFAHKAV